MLGHRLAVVGVVVAAHLFHSALLAVETKPLSPRDIFPATPENVGAAARERMYVAPKFAPPDRMYEVGVSVGLPYLIGLEAGLQLLKKWQFGVSYGLLPQSGIIPDMPLPSITQVVGGVLEFRLDPVAKTSLSIIAPFVRFFPTERTFYLQLSWGLLFSSHRTVSGLVETVTDTTVPDATIVADINLTTSLPTLSVGYFFWRRFFFANVSIGGTFLLSSTSTVKITASLPAAVGTLSGAEEASMKASLDRGLSDVVAQFRERVVMVPSLMFSTGIMF